MIDFHLLYSVINSNKNFKKYINSRENLEFFLHNIINILTASIFITSGNKHYL